MNRAGMTLIEVLVGLAVGAAALSVGYAAFTTVADSNERAAAAADEATRSAAVRETLTEWLRGARLTVETGGPTFQGIDGVRDDYSDDEVVFLTTSPTSLGPGEAIVRLHIDRDENTPERGLVAELSEWRATARERIEIEPAAGGVELRFLSGIPGEEQWYPSWISTSVLPRGIELQLQSSPDTALAPLLRRPIRVPVGGAS